MRINSPRETQLFEIPPEGVCVVLHVIRIRYACSTETVGMTPLTFSLSVFCVFFFVGVVSGFHVPSLSLCGRGKMSCK